jgi:sugar lactone lactonase YvrE
LKKLALAFVFALGCGGREPVTERRYAPGERHAEYLFSRTDQFPEGAAFDPKSRSFFAGSLARGDITRMTLDGAESIFAPRSAATGESTLGMAVDERNRRLWVCSLVDAASKAGVVTAFDIDAAVPVYTAALADARQGASCNDIAVDQLGAAFVTDRENAAIYRLVTSGEAPAIWSSHPLLAPGTVGANGIAITADGSTMLVTQYKPARLLRISVADPTGVSTVALRGDSFSGGISIASGADGIRLLDGALYVAFDRWLMRVTPDDPSWAAAAVSSKRLSTMEYGVTALAEAEGDLYAANGQTAMFLLGLRPALPFKLLRVDPALFEDTP